MAEPGNMVRDSRDEWPSDEPIGSFDIDLGTTEGYQNTAHILFVCPNGKRCAVLLAGLFLRSVQVLRHGFAGLLSGCKQGIGGACAGNYSSTRLLQFERTGRQARKADASTTRDAIRNQGIRGGCAA